MALAAGPVEFQRRRGRPRGSGIDDGARLADIRARLAEAPDMTPTAAIRATGITDPSVIRRLRDKLAAGGPTLATPSAEPNQRRRQTVLPPAPARATQGHVSSRDLPPESTSTEARKREADLLAAYLEALAKAPPPPEPAPEPQPKSTPPPEPPPTADHPSRSPPPGQTMPPFPFAGMMPGFGAMPAMPTMPNFGMPMMPPMMGFPGMPQMPPMPHGMSIPGLPSFLQPFQSKSAPPAAGTSAARQLETFKLAIEAMTAIARLQLHLIENAPAYSPMALMLQGQTFIGQMMMASLTGQIDALRRSAPPGTPP